MISVRVIFTNFELPAMIAWYCMEASPSLPVLPTSLFTIKTSVKSRCESKHSSSILAPFLFIIPFLFSSIPNITRLFILLTGLNARFPYHDTRSYACAHPLVKKRTSTRVASLLFGPRHLRYLVPIKEVRDNISVSKPTDHFPNALHSPVDSASLITVPCYLIGFQYSFSKREFIFRELTRSCRRPKCNNRP